MGVFLLVLVFLLLGVATAPQWPYARAWGYCPSSSFTLVAVMLVLVLVLG